MKITDKINKIIDKINNSYLCVNYGIVIGSSDFYLIPTITISKLICLNIAFCFLNIVLEMNFEIKHYDN